MRAVILCLRLSWPRTRKFRLPSKAWLSVATMRWVSRMRGPPITSCSIQTGGEINVSANEASDKGSIDQIRMHLGHIARMFATGNFNAPMPIDDTNPPGVAGMTRLKDAIKYEHSETESRSPHSPGNGELSSH